MPGLIFKNYGGSYQLRICGAQDMENIRVLNETHWAATSIPVNSLNCDPVFMSYVDTDRNGRIGTGELKEAQAWLFRFLAGRGHLSEGIDILNLDDIDTGHPDGRKIRSVAELILSNLNLEGESKITLSQVRDRQNIMANAANNGDGIIPPEAVSDPTLAQFILSVMDAVGSVIDAGGKAGIGKDQLEVFFREAASYLAWKAQGEIPESSDSTDIMPWGSETPRAYELVAGLDEKIEQYFIQCAIIGFDERTGGRMRLSRKELESIDFTDKAAMESRIKSAPLASPEPKGILDLESEINPFYAESLLELRSKVLKRALGGRAGRITRKQWKEIKDTFLPYKAWLDNKQGQRVEKLGEDKLRAYLNGAYKKQVSDIIAGDRSVAGGLERMHNLEKLILYQKWLMKLANNFVNFSDLYDPNTCSLFEMGTLVIDGRQITFTMKIYDRQAHKSTAEKSCMYLLYAEITGRPGKNEKFDIVAAVTSGTAGRIHLGKRGVFFTADGRQWDAEIVGIVENPISIWESIKAPFGQFRGFIGKQIDRFTRSRHDKLEKNFTSPSASSAVRDLLLGGGIAIAALGSSFAYVTKALSQVRLTHIFIVLAAIAAAILLPGIIAGFIKIRKRDMSVILEASGWAVNARMRLGASLGSLFTHTPALPKNARRERKDAVAQFVKELGYAPLGSGRLSVIILIILLGAIGLTLIFFTFPALR